MRGTSTANDIGKLPPEFIRKGRFDEMFFVGLPQKEERQAIWKVHLRKPQKVDQDIKIDKLVKLSEGHTGAEIAEAVVSGMYSAFVARERCVTQKDFEAALKEYVSLSKSHAPMISGLSAWGMVNARSASGD